MADAMPMVCGVALVLAGLPGPGAIRLQALEASGKTRVRVVGQATVGSDLAVFDGQFQALLVPPGHGV